MFFKGCIRVYYGRWCNQRGFKFNIAYRRATNHSLYSNAYARVDVHTFQQASSQMIFENLYKTNKACIPILNDENCSCMLEMFRATVI